MMEIDFAGAKVAEVAIDYTLRVQCDPSGGFRIEVPLTVERDGTARTLPVGFADLTPETVFDDLVGRRVVRGHATDDGVLTLEFEGDVRIVAAVDPRYESWAAWVPSGAVYSAGPNEKTRHSPQPASLGWSERHATKPVDRDG